MRGYEAVFIFDSALEEERIGEKLERYHSLVAGDGTGEVTATDHWGKRQLAYPIEDRESGYYVVSHFNTEPASLPELERILKLDDELLRYLIVVNEGELTTSPASIRMVDPEAEEEDDEEDEDEEE